MRKTFGQSFVRIVFQPYCVVLFFLWTSPRDIRLEPHPKLVRYVVLRFWSTVGKDLRFCLPYLFDAFFKRVLIAACGFAKTLVF